MLCACFGSLAKLNGRTFAVLDAVATSACARFAGGPLGNGFFCNSFGFARFGGGLLVGIDFFCTGRALGGGALE